MYDITCNIILVFFVVSECDIPLHPFGYLLGGFMWIINGQVMPKSYLHYIPSQGFPVFSVKNLFVEAVNNICKYKQLLGLLNMKRK